MPAPSLPDASETPPVLDDPALLQNLLLVGGAFALGGILKGAIGAGAPLLAVPVLSLLYDVPTAITLFAIPNVVPNAWQTWQFRRHALPATFLWPFVLAGLAGTAAGTVFMANADTDHLLVIVSVVVMAYVGFRLLRPHWVLDYPLARRICAPVGFVSGAMQASAGISAPVSITFLNAMKLERGAFIATISALFVGVACVQIPMLVFFGFMTPTLFLLGCAALAVIMAFMPVGAYLVRKLSRTVFDRLILALLVILAARMLWQFSAG